MWWACSSAVTNSSELIKGPWKIMPSVIPSACKVARLVSKFQSAASTRAFIISSSGKFPREAKCKADHLQPFLDVGLRRGLHVEEKPLRQLRKKYPLYNGHGFPSPRHGAACALRHFIKSSMPSFGPFACSLHWSWMTGHRPSLQNLRWTIAAKISKYPHEPSSNSYNQ